MFGIWRLEYDRALKVKMSRYFALVRRFHPLSLFLKSSFFFLLRQTVQNAIAFQRASSSAPKTTSLFSSSASIDICNSSSCASAVLFADEHIPRANKTPQYPLSRPFRSQFQPLSTEGENMRRDVRSTGKNEGGDSSEVSNVPWLASSRCPSSTSLHFDSPRFIAVGRDASLRHLLLVATGATSLTHFWRLLQHQPVPKDLPDQSFRTLRALWDKRSNITLSLPRTKRESGRDLIVR
ncbi:hypothetical protein SCHPADRAFT_452221 [Schizopora paradoxa]|uniref:Uncharacterized protein n=1 Tax=Schizopora paradoxa TaxID=27342 RepID=A0A0H2RJM6_9AGAM|nr:hypothetical protein SCHPADRAFT_452221 [Schizopora paradoxa]